MRFILGPPCSGKGTITGKITEIPSISAGNLLRKLCETPEYAHLKEIVNTGGLVATDLMCNMLIEEAAKYNFDVFIDGFPRTVDQARMIKKFMIEKDIKCKGIFCVYAPLHVLLTRVSTRTYCKECHYTDSKHIDHCETVMGRRDDDNIETLVKRLDVFHSNLQEILQIMTGPIFMIDNNRDIDDVLSEVRTFLKTTETYIHNKML